MNSNNSGQNKPVAVITGGGTGLGLAISTVLLAKGYRVRAVGLDQEEEVQNDNYEFLELDVLDLEAVKKLAAQEKKLDVLVNAAGIILHRGLEHTLEGFARVVDVNLIGTNQLCVALRDALAAGRGSIINIASMWSYFGSPNNPAYAASKGAIVSLTRSLAAAHASDGIRVNAIAPGWIKTAMSRHAFNDPARSRALRERIPLGDWGEPEDIANAAAFLVSPEARYITGVVLPVDGGFSIA